MTGRGCPHLDQHGYLNGEPPRFRYTGHILSDQTTVVGIISLASGVTLGKEEPFRADFSLHDGTAHAAGLSDLTPFSDGYPPTILLTASCDSIATPRR